MLGSLFSYSFSHERPRQNSFQSNLCLIRSYARDRAQWESVQNQLWWEQVNIAIAAKQSCDRKIQYWMIKGLINTLKRDILQTKRSIKKGQSRDGEVSFLLQIRQYKDAIGRRLNSWESLKELVVSIDLKVRTSIK